MAVPGREIRLEQRFLHRREGRRQFIRFGHQCAHRRHLAVLEAFVDPCPSPESRRLGEIVSEPRQIERGQDRAGVAGDTVFLDEGGNVGLECVGRRGQARNG